MKRLFLCLGAGLTACSHTPHTQSMLTEDQLQTQVRAFAPAKLSASLEGLPESERLALAKIIEAARLLDPIYDRQVYRQNPELRQSLAQDTSALGQVRLRYFDIMRGPWDRQDHMAPFAIDKAHPKGAGFYPEDLSEAEFKAALKAQPGDAEQLQSLVTVVERDGDRLIAKPYSKVYAAWLKPAAKLLKEAADLTQNPSLATFLRLRADAFLSDDYYASDLAWMDLDSQVEVTIGPYEVYEDLLMGLKASFEAYVTVTDPEASKKLAHYKALLPDMEANLPIPDTMKTVRGKESPIRVVDLVFSSGEARKSVQTLAFNLPNDERVRREKGAKKVMMQNIIMTKFDRILRPIGERILVDAQQSELSADAFFNQVLFHELSHSLGPAFTQGKDGPVEVRVVLGSTYSAIEEAKADVMGAYNVLYMIERGELPKAMADKLRSSYFIGLFRSVRFGVSSAHGKGAALQLNRFLSEGAATWDAKLGRFKVNHQAFDAAVSRLVRDLCVLQHHGDKAAAEALLASHGQIGPAIETALSKLDGIPVDLAPIYPVAGETRPSHVTD